MLRASANVRRRLKTKFCLHTELMFCSDKTKQGGDSREHALREKLFENISAPEEKLASVVAEELPAAKPNKVLSFLGNTILYGMLGSGALLGYYQYRYTAEEMQHIIDQSNEGGNLDHRGGGVLNRVMKCYIEYRKYFENEMKKYADPPSDNLLPDLPPQASHIKTLVLDLDNVLIHSDWTRGRGWRTFKRPGADEFIKDLAQYFELVVYTSQLPTYADPILDRLDPQRMIQYRLYRDSTNYVDGKHVRDLSKLNRDLRQVLMITADTDAYSLQPENAIKLKKWKTNEKEDTTLLDMLPFLEAIVRTNVPDVRAVVKSYEGQDIPTAFKQRMSKVSSVKSKSKAGGFLRRSDATNSTA